MLTRNLLLYLSESRRFKSFLTRFKAFNNVTKRFVAGEQISDAAEAIRQLNGKGITASFDHLGESIKSEAETRDEVNEYLRVLEAIDKHGLDSNVSVKITKLGLDIDPDLCIENARKIVERAAISNNFVRIDMEDSTKTEATIHVFERLRREMDNVGIVIQSYLYRSAKDVERLLEMGARIRLCKGAYSEPATVAYPRKADVDANYVELMQTLLDSEIYHGIATHDEAMIAATKSYAGKRGISTDRFEFQMLFGIRRDLQEKLIKEGYRVRVYVPYGRFRYPYFNRRLAERPANIGFVLRNMIKG